VASIGQADFGAGIYRGRKAPAGSAYNLLNALIDDEGQPFLRGKSAYKSNTNAGATLLGVADTFTAAGARTIFTSGVTGSGHWVLDVDDATPAPLTTNVEWKAFSRGAAGAGAVFFPLATGYLWAYGGSRKPGGYNTGTVTATAGSTTLTGVGTAWTTNIDAGTLLSLNGAGNYVAIAQSVDSDTSVTLAKPWPFTTFSGVIYQAEPVFEVIPDPIFDYFSGASNPPSSLYMAAVGAVPRLLVATKQRAFLSQPGNPWIFNATDYLELPSDAEIIGADAFQDSGIVFTTRGVWTLGGLDFDPVDDAGNVQWQQQQVSKDVILWSDPGIVAWEGVLIVPAVDDVYLFAPNGEAQPVSQAIRPLYRSYVKAGYQPGTAAVHRGHYFLPILNGTTLVDEIVCRLDRPPRPWTRWSGHAAGLAYTQRIGASTRSPKLFSIAGQRVTDLTGCMDTVSSLQDADSTTPTFTVETNDLTMSQGRGQATAEKAVAVYETTGGTPAVSLSSAVGPEGAAYTAASLKRGGGASDGTGYSAWKITRSADRIRLKVECASQVTSLVLRSVELYHRVMNR
jgi:hypothetical protein